MKVEFLNRTPSIDNALVEDALHFYSSLLLTRAQDHKVYIEIEYRRLDKVEDAYIEIIDTENSLPEDFRISIHSRLCKKAFLIILAHEFVHLSDMVKGDYYPHDMRSSTWKNKKVDTTSMDYWDYPWELHAESLQRGMHAKFFKHRKGNI